MKRAICLVVVLLASSRVVQGGERAAVLVLPFEAAQGDKQWVGKAVQQTLVAELSAVASLSGRAGAKAAGSPDEAVSLAREAGAKHVIFGGVQAANGELRVTGVVMDVGSSQATAVLRATGAERELFALQDQVSSQAMAALSVGGSAEPVEPARAPATAETPQTQPATRYATRVERSVANIEQGTDQIRRLEDEIDRLKDRIRTLEREDNLPPVVYQPRYDDYYDFYPYHYYSPALFYFTPIHGRHSRHHHLSHHRFGSGLKAHGSFGGRHFSGTFRMGAGARRR